VSFELVVDKVCPEYAKGCDGGQADWCELHGVSAGRMAERYEC
jgi:hypothetical protein